MDRMAFKAGVVQMDVRLGDADANLKTAADALARLADEGVELAALPEMWSCGFDNLHLARHADQTPRILDHLSKAAASHGMVIAGSMPEAADGAVYNTQYVVDKTGAVAGAYRKIHLFSMTREHEFFRAGDAAVVCDTSLGPIGLMICYDLRFPELCRTLTLKGAPVVAISAQWPKIRISRWDILTQARAIENQIYIVAVNRCGTENTTVFGGRSVIVGPGGEILSQAGDRPFLGTAHIDLDKLAEVRRFMPSLSERVPAAYAL